MYLHIFQNHALHCPCLCIELRTVEPCSRANVLSQPRPLKPLTSGNVGIEPIKDDETAEGLASPIVAHVIVDAAPQVHVTFFARLLGLSCVLF